MNYNSWEDLAEMHRDIVENGKVTENRLETLMVAEPCGRIAYEWKRALIFIDKHPEFLVRKIPKVWYITKIGEFGQLSCQDEKPEGWDDTTD
jgi:hypothetical protein